MEPAISRPIPRFSSNIEITVHRGMPLVGPDHREAEDVPWVCRSTRVDKGTARSYLEDPSNEGIELKPEVAMWAVSNGLTTVWRRIH